MEMGYILGSLSAITELFLNTSEEIVGKHAPARVIVIYTSSLVLSTLEICLLKNIRSTVVYMLSYFSGQNTLGQRDSLCPIKLLLKSSLNTPTIIFLSSNTKDPNMSNKFLKTSIKTRYNGFF